jgi:hypothetical protein
MDTIFWTAVAALAASASALIAAVYTWLTFRLVRSQAEPKIVVYVSADPDRQTLILIRIANIGRDIATDIAFKLSRPIPNLVGGLSVETAEPVAENMTDGPLIEGIPVLGPGDSRDITWGQIGGIQKHTGDKPVEVTFTYKQPRRWRSRTFKGWSRLEVRSFLATDASAKPAARSAQSLEQIAKTLGALAKERQR